MGVGMGMRNILNIMAYEMMTLISNRVFQSLVVLDYLLSALPRANTIPYMVAISTLLRGMPFSNVLSHPERTRGHACSEKAQLTLSTYLQKPSHFFYLLFGTVCK